MSTDRNLVLIGMPGAGKSTIGVLLAKRLGRNFVDTDVYIQAGLDRTLQEILDAEGLDGFRRIEEQYVLCLDVRGYVVATGGSVVYSEPAMQRLREHGRIVLLDLPLEELAARVDDIHNRGMVRRADQSFAELYAERMPLYRRWADATVDCAGLTHGQVVDAVLDA